MKKLLLVILSLALLFNFSIAGAATQTSTIKEDKTVNLVVDGTIVKSASVAIIKDKKLMLSTDILSAFGIASKNQVWNKAKTQLTITKGTTKIVLQINNSTATINGTKKTLSVKPLMYKTKAYIPVDFIASCFDKVLNIDTETNSFFLKDKTEFTKNKILFGDILNAMNSVSKLKVEENVNFSLNGTGIELDLFVPATTLTDMDSKVAVSNLHTTQTLNGQREENSLEMILANNSQFTKVNAGEWQKQNFTEDEFKRQFEFDKIFDYNDLICSALSTANGSNKDDIILMGKVNMGVSVPVFLKSQGLTKNTITSKYIQIALNKDTHIVSQIDLKITGTTLINNMKFNFALDYTISYSDVNGSFDIVIPEGIK